jgi:hypothetical protein
MQLVAIQPRLDGLAGKLGRNGLENTEYARDGYELGVKFMAENAGGEVFARPGHSASAKWTINMYTPIRRYLSSSTHHRRHNEVAIARVYALARANRLRVHQSRLTS